MKLITLHGINVGKDQIDVFLRKRVKGSSGGNNAAKEGVIVFDVGFLIGSVGVAEEERGFFKARGVVFKSEDVGKLAAVIGQDQREQVAKDDAVMKKDRLKVSDFSGGFRSGFVVKKDTEHEGKVNELKSHDDLTSDPTDNGIHLSDRKGRIILAKSDEVLKRAADLGAFRDIVRSGLFTGLKFDCPGEVNATDRVVTLVDVTVDS